MLEPAGSPEHAAIPPAAATDDLHRVRAVIEALPEAVLVIDADGTLRLTNPAADHLFAPQPVRDRADFLSRFEVVGGDLLDQGGRDRPLVPDTGPTTVRQRDQPNRWYALRTIELAAEGDDRGAPVANGPAAGPTVVVLRDVTDSPDLQPEREAFLSVLSHELRTPITTISAGSTVLARRPNLDVPQSEGLARDISAEAARLYDLVEDLLVLARLERHVLQPIDEPVYLHRSVDAAIRVVRERTPNARVIRTGMPVPPAVHGDATYVDQVCRNLVFGALRATGPASDDAVVISLEVDSVATEVACTISDRGPALSAGELARAFELPGSSANGRLAAGGIGLFVVRHLVDAMGGRTWARNRPEGTGMELGFALPVHPNG